MKLGKYIFDVTRHLATTTHIVNHFLIISNCSTIWQHFVKKKIANINQFLNHSKTSNSSCLNRTQNKFGNEPDHL